MRTLLCSRFSVLFLFSFVIILPMVSATRSQDDEGSKGIKSEEVVSRAAKKSGGPTHSTTRATYTSKGKRPVVPPRKGEEDVRLGLTLFRFEPRGAVYRPGGEGTKDIFMEGTEDPPTPPKQLSEWNVADWTRAMPESQFAVGQVVRLHFEPLTSSRYLYIVHQELYADGTSGAASLLFPTLRTNNGDNLVEANKDLWIPRAPAYFQIKPSVTRKNHVGELITVILRPDAPANLLPQPLANKPMALSTDDLARLIARATGAPVSLNLNGGAGQKQTPQEGRKDIGMEGEEALTQDDPLPQTVYETRGKSGQPVVFRVPLKFKTP